ncbi:MAG: histidine phosphatase family protein, partial [Myxococcota bacterium]
LVRHCATEASGDGRYCGRLNIGLTREGQAQAQVLAAFLFERRPTSLFCSPLKRSMQTAKPLSKVSKLEAQPLEDMVEQDFGQWDGLTEAQMRERDSALVDQWRAAPQDVALPAGENITQVAERAKRVLKHIRSSDPDGVSCAVGHKTFNRVLISLLEELPLESYRRSVPQPVGAINIIEWDGRDAARVRGVGLTGHFG